MNSVPQHPFEEENQATRAKMAKLLGVKESELTKDKEKTTSSKIGLIWWVIIAMVGLTVLGGVGAVLTDNVAFFLSLIPLLVIPALLIFGFYILCELLSALEFIGYCCEFVAWCAKKFWGGIKFILGFRSEPTLSSESPLNQQDKPLQ